MKAPRSSSARCRPCRAGARVADYGCGSGVIAAAARDGAGYRPRPDRSRQRGTPGRQGKCAHRPGHSRLLAQRRGGALGRDPFQPAAACRHGREPRRLDAAHCRGTRAAAARRPPAARACSAACRSKICWRSTSARSGSWPTTDAIASGARVAASRRCAAPHAEGKVRARRVAANLALPPTRPCGAARWERCHWAAAAPCGPSGRAGPCAGSPRPGPAPSSLVLVIVVVLARSSPSAAWAWARRGCTRRRACAPRPRPRPAPARCRRARSLPNSSSSASGFLMCSWMTRASGRAPNFSS